MWLLFKKKKQPDPILKDTYYVKGKKARIKVLDMVLGEPLKKKRYYVECKRCEMSLSFSYLDPDKALADARKRGHSKSVCDQLYVEGVNKW